MRLLRVIALAAGLAAAACAPESQDPPPAPESAPDAVAGPQLSAGGFGPVRVGMTAEEAGAALGAPLKAGAASDDPQACDIATPTDASAFPGLQFLTIGGRIDRASIYAPRGEDAGPASLLTTEQGIGLGATSAEVRAAYPGAVEQLAKYNPPPAHDLMVWEVPYERGLRFEIDAAGAVWAIHAGGPTILYVEGCS